MEKVVTLQQEEQNIDETVAFLQKVLNEEYAKNNNCPIKYYDYVTDKSSFSKTVENIFHCAFLARDGKVQLALDENSTAIISPVSKKELKRFRAQNLNSTQIITSITMEDWQVI